MAKIAYILLCHRDPEGVITQARRLTQSGDFVAIHFDKRADPADYAKLRSALDRDPHVAFAKKRIKCGWGEWSLVAATIEAVAAAEAAFPDATHFYMLSGDCMPIKSAKYIRDYLDHDDVDYIEAVDFFDGGWIKTGIKEERLIYRHLVNERKYKPLFYGLLNLQRKLGLSRPIPADLRIMIGSQWWCLRRTTIEAILEFVAARRDVTRFFRTTWIPDETFFQTLVRHLVPAEQIRNRTLTFLMFTDYGMPLTFYNDSYDLLLGQDSLFARKISPEAKGLKTKLADLYANDDAQFEITNEGRSLFQFMTKQGRIGMRFAPRFWETESTLGRERELLIVLCKKWHVGKRLVRKIAEKTNVPVIEYLFDEESTALPDLGGIQSSLGKRTRHRRSLMRMLYDYYETDHLVICLDPDNMDLLRDFNADRSRTRMLEIECEMSDEYLLGHAQRIGLVGANARPETLAQLVPTVRGAVLRESDNIRDAEFDHLYIMRQSASPEENAVPLTRFLDISHEMALDLAKTDHLFFD